MIKKHIICDSEYEYRKIKTILHENKKFRSKYKPVKRYANVIAEAFENNNEILCKTRLDARVKLCEYLEKDPNCKLNGITVKIDFDSKSSIDGSTSNLYDIDKLSFSTWEKEFPRPATGFETHDYKTADKLRKILSKAKRLPKFDVCNKNSNFTSMFSGLTSLEEGPEIVNISTNTSDIASTVVMFAWCKNLKRTPDYKILNLDDAGGMYIGCKSLEKPGKIIIDPKYIYYSMAYSRDEYPWRFATSVDIPEEKFYRLSGSRIDDIKSKVHKLSHAIKAQGMFKQTNTNMYKKYGYNGELFFKDLDYYWIHKDIYKSYEEDRDFYIKRYINLNSYIALEYDELGSSEPWKDDFEKNAVDPRLYK